MYAQAVPLLLRGGNLRIRHIGTLSHAHGAIVTQFWSCSLYPRTVSAPAFTFPEDRDKPCPVTEVGASCHHDALGLAENTGGTVDCGFQGAAGVLVNDREGVFSKQKLSGMAW